MADAATDPFESDSITVSHDYYMQLPNGTVIPTDDPDQWGMNMVMLRKTGQHAVGQTYINADGFVAPIFISTVFLGLNHNWRENGPPLIYETMIFNFGSEEYQRRYTDRWEAHCGHQAAINYVRRELTLLPAYGLDP